MSDIVLHYAAYSRYLQKGHQQRTRCIQISFAALSNITQVSKSQYQVQIQDSNRASETMMVLAVSSHSGCQSNYRIIIVMKVLSFCAVLHTSSQPPCSMVTPKKYQSSTTACPKSIALQKIIENYNC